MKIAVDFTELRGNDPIEFSLIGVFFFSVFLIPNRETKQPLCALTVTVREVEKVTGYDFFNFLPEPTQERLELIVSTNDWIWIVEK